MVLLLAVPSLAAQDAVLLQQHSQLQQRSTLSQPNYLRTNLQVAGFIGGLWSYDRYVTRQPWAVIGTNSIKANFQHGFEWDRGEFGMNQILHPYSGNLYYSAARANNLSFWQSAAYTAGGSLVWELFMENHYPSRNDMITTTLGGIALGEVLYRLSNLCIDESAIGWNRFSREALATVINPMNGLNRWLDGRMKKRSGYRDDSHLNLTLLAGGNSEQAHQHYDLMQPHVMVGLQLEYNELFQSVENRKPFDYFMINLMAVGYRDNTIPLVHVMGHVFGREKETEHFSILGGSFLQYDFTNTDLMKLSTTSIGPGVEIRSRVMNTHEFTFGFHAQLIAMGGIDSPYHLERMDYNLGPGYALNTRLSYGHVNGLMLNLNGSKHVIYNVQGADGTELVHMGNAGLDIPLYKSLRYGVAYSYYHRNGQYDTHPDTHGYSDMLRTYIKVTT
jgi:hypothetical protein